MPAKVTLKVVEGPLTGKEYVFEERATCLVGRGVECEVVQIPDDEPHQVIGRTHCLLDINPPDIRVRDFGSLNGTMVNGKKIGQRQAGQTREQAIQDRFPEYDLKDGDKIGLVHTVFQVGVYVPAYCNDCSLEIPEDKRAAWARGPGVFRCDSCQKRAEAAGKKGPPVKKVPLCGVCGRNVSDEAQAGRDGAIICIACQKDPRALLAVLLGRAMKGDSRLSSIKDYNILRELGRGGMGAVYLATHQGSGRQVALKLMLPSVAALPGAVQKFLREVECTKVLEHRNVVKMHDFGTADGAFFFTLEFCLGGSVDHLMARRGGTLPLKEACEIMLQALDGLEYAHHVDVRVRRRDGTYSDEKGLVHRDLSPQNILLASAASPTTPKVSDYGLSKAFDAAGLSGQSVTNGTAGKPVFMPRQQVVDFKYSKPEVDVWAAAATLYNMLTGAYPRDFPNAKDVWQTVLNTDAVPIRRRKASIPAKLAEVIDAALVDRPEIQFKSAVELKRALEGAL
jgi:hypothetical protein